MRKISKSPPVRPPRSRGTPLSFAIVSSQYNAQYVRPLVDHALRELGVLEPGAAIVRITTPGSFEIPLAVQTAAELGRHQAILALGVIFHGETAHATLIAGGITTALLNISLQHRVPVIHGVLLMDNPRQAKARCLGKDINRGTEAARAAVAMARTLREIR